eukprot:Selendium_serpulae@DN6373_c1_g1_i9.p1
MGIESEEEFEFDSGIIKGQPLAQLLETDKPTSESLSNETHNINASQWMMMFNEVQRMLESNCQNNKDVQQSNGGPGNAANNGAEVDKDENDEKEIDDLEKLKSDNSDDLEQEKLRMMQRSPQRAFVPPSPSSESTLPSSRGPQETRDPSEDRTAISQTIRDDLSSAPSSPTNSPNDEIFDSIDVGKNDDGESKIVGICYDKSEMRWRAEWYQNDKRRTKTFKVAEFGFEGAKAKAAEYRKLMDRTGRAGQQKRIEDPKLQSGIKGVTFHSRYNVWEARWYEGGKRIHRSFSVDEFGFEGAKQKAIELRRKMEAKISKKK